MDTNAAFIAAMAADPGDDTARLAFADWLEESGGPHERARGQFIRLQCGLGDPATRDAQAAELEREHRAAWDRPFAPLRSTAEYRRGFPYRLHAPLDRLVLHQELLGLAPEWLLCPGRKGREPEPGLCARLAAGPFADRVRGLDLAGTGEEELRALLVPPLVGRLRELHLGRSADPLALLWAIAAAPGLRLGTLDCSAHYAPGIGDEGCRLVAESPRFATLTELRLPHNGVTATGLDALAGSAHLTQLRTLDLEGNRTNPAESPDEDRVATLSDAGADALAGSANFRHLTNLKLTDNGVTDRGVLALLASPHLGALAALNLALNYLSDAALVALAGSDGLPALRWLNVSAGSRPGITGTGVTRLVASPRMARLVGLKLGSQPIGDAGARALARSPNCRNLTELHVGGCEIGRRAFARLLDSPHLAGVAEFSARCNRLTDAEVADLRARHPGRVS